MTIYYINTGSSANKGDGDTLRTAFNKINSNFGFLSTATGGGGGNTDWTNIGNITGANGPTNIAIGQNAQTPASYSVPQSFNGSTWDGTQFVAVGVDQNVNFVSATSPDGATWTNHVTSISFTGLGVVYNGTNQYVAVGTNFEYPFNYFILTSPDAVNWTQQTTGSGWLGGITYNGLGQYIAVGSNLTNDSIILTSPNGVTWTPQTTITRVYFNSITWNGVDQYVAVGGIYITPSPNYYYASIYTSPDGVTWTAQQEETYSYALNTVVWDPVHAQYVAIGTDIDNLKALIVTSSDAISWTQQAAGQYPTDGNFNGLAVDGAGNYIATGVASGQVLILSSTDGGVTWIRQANALTTLTANSAACDPSTDLFVAVGSGILKSIGLSSWSIVAYPAGFNNIAIGEWAGRNNQQNYSLAIGSSAGQEFQGANAVAIGAFAGNTSQGVQAVAIGTDAGSQNQKDNAIAIGSGAGGGGQGFNATAIGIYAGSYYQKDSAIAIGPNAGTNNQGVTAVAIGQTAGYDNQGNNAVSIGLGAGENSQGANSVAIGLFAGRNYQPANTVILNASGNNLNGVANQTDSFYVAPVRNDATATNNTLYYNTATKEVTYGPAAPITTATWATLADVNNNNGPINIALGANAGLTNQGNSSVALGNGAGFYGQGISAVAIGNNAGQLTQGNYAVSLGIDAGSVNQGDYSVAIGLGAGQNTQTIYAVAIGTSAGNVAQGNYAVAIGVASGNQTQGACAVAAGPSAGQFTQGASAVAIGDTAGTYTQGPSAVAIGRYAGNDHQGDYAVAIGDYAGGTTQSSFAVAIGPSAGSINQGANAIAIGNNAGNSDQAANSIILNATGVAVNGVANVASAFYVAPIRNDVTATNNTLYYNTTTFEISYGPAAAGGGGNDSVVQSDTAPAPANTSTLWYDTVSGRTYVYFDGAWVDANPAIEPSTATVDLSAVAQDIVPAIDSFYDLGSPSHQWKSLYVSTNTIYVGNVPLTVDTLTNTLLVNGSQVSSSGGLSVLDFGDGFSLTTADKIVTRKLYSTNATDSNQHYRLELDTNGVVVLPDQSIINGSTLRGIYGTGEANYTGITIGPDAAHQEESWMYVDHTGSYIATQYNTNQKLWQFKNDGSTVLPSGAGFARGDNGQIKTSGDTLTLDLRDTSGCGFYTNNDGFSLRGDGDSTWKFGTNGSLTFPDSTVQSTAWTGSTDRLTSTGTSAVLAKDQYNTTRLTFTGSATIETAGYLSGTGGLALVDSSSQQYVIVKSDRVQINTGFPDQGTGLQSYNEWQFLKSGVFKLPTTGIIENSGKQWTFGTNGDLTLPTGGEIKSAAGTGDVVIEANNGTLRTWTFGGDGKLTTPGDLISNNQSIKFSSTTTDHTSYTVTDNTIKFGNMSNSTVTWDIVTNNYSTGFTNTRLVVPTSTANTNTYVSFSSPSNTTVLQSSDLINQMPGGRPGFSVISSNAINLVTNPDSGSHDGDAHIGYGWTFDNAGGLTFPDSTTQTTAYKRTTGSWTIAAGTGTYSITVPANGVYQIWVRGNIDNGILSYVATAHVTNPNVPVIGSQRGYNYTDGGSPILLTSMPSQFIGTEGTIATGSIAGTTNNVFEFGISNSSGSTQTVYWGYVTL